jgi:hypothetical protein
LKIVASSLPPIEKKEEQMPGLTKTFLSKLPFFSDVDDPVEYALKLIQDIFSSPDKMGCALKKMCRFGGGIPVFYSVLEHSDVVHEITKQLAEEAFGKDSKEYYEACFYALIHDITETIVGDCPSPFKPEILRECERRLREEFYSMYNVDPPSSEVLELVEFIDHEIVAVAEWEILKEPYTKEIPLETSGENRELVDFANKLVKSHLRAKRPITGKTANEDEIRFYNKFTEYTQRLQAWDT